MASVAVLRLRTDDDWLRMVAYRETLREIVRAHPVEPWGERDPVAEMAAKMLEQFGDLPTDG